MQQRIRSLSAHKHISDLRLGRIYATSNADAGVDVWTSPTNCARAAAAASGCYVLIIVVGGFPGACLAPFASANSPPTCVPIAPCFVPRASLASVSPSYG